jgi:hypothetical protein
LAGLIEEGLEAWLWRKAEGASAHLMRRKRKWVPAEENEKFRLCEIIALKARRIRTRSSSESGGKRIVKRSRNRVAVAGGWGNDGYFWKIKVI